jgi:CheY-like chemotaxis protein
MDGLEASAKIMELNTGIPIVAMTANIMVEDREVYRQYGMRDCVGKPFTAQELWHCLMKYFTPKAKGKEQKIAQIEAELEFQKSLQLSFVKGNKNKYDEITEAIKKGDLILAHRLVHTLKSNAGQIGKNILQKAAADVEFHLKQGKNLVTQEQLMVLKTELGLVLSELAPLVNETFVQSTVKTFVLEPQDAQELLAKLEPLLKMGNPECLNHVDKLRRIQGSEVLIEQIENFKFETALKTLENLKDGFL